MVIEFGITFVDVSTINFQQFKHVMLNCLTDAGKEACLELNIERTKYMLLSHDTNAV
jgi:hypothetical protein